jgi:hypothetical protein
MTKVGPWSIDVELPSDAFLRSVNLNGTVVATWCPPPPPPPPLELVPTYYDYGNKFVGVFWLNRANPTPDEATVLPKQGELRTIHGSPCRCVVVQRDWSDRWLLGDCGLSSYRAEYEKLSPISAPSTQVPARRWFARIFGKQ